MESSSSSVITVGGPSVELHPWCARENRIGVAHKLGRRQEKLYQEIDSLRTYTYLKRERKRERYFKKCWELDVVKNCKS